MNFKTISVLLAIVTAVCAQATKNEYELKDGDGKTCLRADMALTIQVNYNKSNQQEPVIFQWSLPKYNATDPSTVVVGGSCAANGTAELTLSTPAGSTSVSMTFTMEGQDTYLSGVELSYTEDPDVFVNTTKPDNNVTVTTTDLKEFLAPAGKSYKCNNEGSLALNEPGAMLNLADVQVQAFGYNNSFGDGNFQPVQNNYTLTSDGKVCLMALMALQIEANYTKNDGKEGSAKWNVPANPAVSGTCGNDTSVLTLTYDGTASNITITFTRSGANGLLQDDGKFMASAITVVYTETSARFPDTNSSDVVRSVSSTNLTAFEGSVGSSYKCMAEQDVTLSDTVMLIATDVQVQPFGLTDNNFDTAEECPADNEISNIVPIAVGCALAGLVVIVLIAYLIGRRKSHKGYQQV
ncbi:Lysosome-associated membrane glycoprotein 1 [Branchiostoma belcheri]|nr:Lysosome-associated membrane glycoprotein 1 [Branchiostoma belcheri]